MKYIYSVQSQNRHLIHVQCISEPLDPGTYHVQLPSWRPGRYELGNFAKNITAFNIKDQSGRKLSFQKVTKDKWKVDVSQKSAIHIEYDYYAADLNAGSSYADGTQLYINPVNLSVYLEDAIHEPCQVEVRVPSHYTIATGMKKENGYYHAADFHELADSPLIASPTLQSERFTVAGAEFYLWFQGYCQPDMRRIVHDFKQYTEAILESFGSFPFTSYHYLIQVLPVPFYHGVEHLNSTVIALGPGYKLMDRSVYDELLGVCCHELYHAWNIKTIRPVEMQPYDYSSENYTRLGYVAEGVTTYFGDLYLLRGKVFNPDQYLETLTERYQKHRDNPGRLNMPVAEASFDTWLDGYVPGIPNRKTSIYDEGCILAFMTDVLIRRHSHNKNNLDTVMRELYVESGSGKGYSESDYKSLVEKAAGTDLSWFFTDYMYGVRDTESLFNECLQYLGLRIQKLNNAKVHEDYGIRGVDDHGYFKVTHVHPGSSADKALIAVGDKIIAFNGMELQHNIHEMFAVNPRNEKIRLGLFSRSELKEVVLDPCDEVMYSRFRIVRATELTPEQGQAYKSWAWEW